MFGDLVVSDEPFDYSCLTFLCLLILECLSLLVRKNAKHACGIFEMCELSRCRYDNHWDFMDVYYNKIVAVCEYFMHFYMHLTMANAAEVQSYI